MVLLYGDNGAGKTNLLEAVSLLAPGRGLRGAALSQMARLGGPGNFSISARLGAADLGTGTIPEAPERRQVRINGAPASVNSLGEWVSVLWLTPAMDRLFSGSPGERRRFLDRLVLAMEPAHAHHSARYEAAMRARSKLLADDPWDEAWLDALEAKMAEHGAEVSAARRRTIMALSPLIEDLGGDDFPASRLELTGDHGDEFRDALRRNRRGDATAKRSTQGPNTQDLSVSYRSTGVPAAQCSTGEQKALLIGIILAHADLVARRRGAPPILLLDEVAAHLDPGRRQSLFDRLTGRGQVWMTATEASLFQGIAEATRLHVETGSVTDA